MRESPTPQIVMVTVDPDRDTAAQLAGYVPYFNAEFVGVTGGADAIADLAAQLNIAFEKVEPKESENESAMGSDTTAYAVAHSTQIVVVDPQAYYTGILTAPHHPERIVEVLTSLMRE